MQERWMCMTCETLGQLSKHGRCATCDSAAVVSETALRNDFVNWSEIVLKQYERELGYSIQ